VQLYSYTEALSIGNQNNQNNRQKVNRLMMIL